MVTSEHSKPVLSHPLHSQLSQAKRPQPVKRCLVGQVRARPGAVRNLDESDPALSSGNSLSLIHKGTLFLQVFTFEPPHLRRFGPPIAVAHCSSPWEPAYFASFLIVAFSYVY